MWGTKTTMDMQSAAATLAQAMLQQEQHTKTITAVSELTDALRLQTAAIAQLADSNRELVVSIAQLIIADAQPMDDMPTDPTVGMGDQRGGYLTPGDPVIGRPPGAD